MEWIKIDPDNLPEGEVLAASFFYGFTDGSFHLGKLYYITWPSGKKSVECHSGNNFDLLSLEECTHYIDIHNCEHKSANL